MSRMRLQIQLSTSQTLGATSCSQLQQATGISGVSNRIEMVQKGMLVYSMSRMELGAQPATSFQGASHQLSLAIARASYGDLNCYRLDRNCSKGNIGLLNNQNETSDIASHHKPLGANSCSQFQLSTAIAGLIEMVQWHS